MIITNKNIEATSRILKYQWDRFHIGFAEYPSGPTGCTVFYFPDKNVNAVVDIRGSNPGSIFTNVLEDSGMTAIDAILIAGGSLLGLEAATGISSEIFKKNPFSINSSKSFQPPIVAGSVLYDWYYRNDNTYPDKQLGIAAFQSAEPNKFYLGQRGAAINARIAKMFGMKYSLPAGAGGAVQTFGDIKIGVFTFINALGAIYGSDNEILYGYTDEKTKKTISFESLLNKNSIFTKKLNNNTTSGNTTISVIITNLSLNLYEMRVIAKQLHNSFSEVIRPYGTVEDGDSLYFISTKEHVVPSKARFSSLSILGTMITKVVNKSIYSAFDNNN